MKKLDKVRVQTVGFVATLILVAFVFGMLMANVKSAGGVMPMLAEAEESSALESLEAYQLVEYQVVTGDRFWDIQQSVDDSVSLEETRWLFPYVNNGKNAGDLKAGETVFLFKKKH